MPREITHAFGILKKAAAIANHELKPEKMTDEKLAAISQACDEVISGALNDHFPLVVWQTGSGTQSNMNANEVIANRGNEIAGKKLLHPNDDINMSQSSNDTFPTAMHISAVIAIEDKLFPAIDTLVATFKPPGGGERGHRQERPHPPAGRHAHHSSPRRSAAGAPPWRRTRRCWRSPCRSSRSWPWAARPSARASTPPRALTSRWPRPSPSSRASTFVTAPNKFHALTSKDELVFAHGALKALAADMMKIANDVRWLASGPRDGLGEIFIPENEPGSSIMPGKVNPTQCEAVTMVAVQVMGNDVAVGMAASQGNFELNVFMPVCIYNFLQSARLLAEVIVSFNNNCAVGIKANREKMHHNLHNSLMLVTALNPYIGYENAAKTAKKAYKENISLKEACVALGFLTAEKFDEVFHPEQMV